MPFHPPSLSSVYRFTATRLRWPGLLLLVGLHVAPPLLAATWQALPRGEIKPRGWMLHQIERDLTSGVLSAYPELRGLGAPIGTNNQRSYFESEGNYFDALVRNAFLSDNAAAIAKARSIMQRALAQRLPNGYFGRGAVKGPNDLLRGHIELWSQCCFLRGALALHEYARDPAVLAAIRSNVDLFRQLFAQGKIRYFQFPDEELLIAGSRTHGLMYVDVLESLYRLTHDERYLQFARELYDDYSNSTVRNADNKLPRLLDREAMFVEHAPHTAEHFRVLFFLADAIGEPRYRQAADDIIYKLRKSQSPSRMLVADPRYWESVAGNYGSDSLPYEYCTITELVTSLASGFTKSVEATLGDDLESLLFNTAQAARFSDGKAVAYYSHDSQCELGYDKAHAGTFRYQYAARHKIGCCTINASRVLPTYIEHMWLKSEDGRTLLAALHGASEVRTVLGGRSVAINASTDYPFGNRITYQVMPESAVAFTLLVRTPQWARHPRITAPGAELVSGTGTIGVTKVWQPGDTIVVEFDDPVRVQRFMNNQLFVAKGPLIYALGIEARRTATETFHGDAFANYNLEPVDPSDREKYAGYRLPPGIDLPDGPPWGKYVARRNIPQPADFPYDSPPGAIEGAFVYRGKLVRAQLLPMGSLLLRKVLFPIAR